MEKAREIPGLQALFEQHIRAVSQTFRPCWVDVTEWVSSYPESERPVYADWHAIKASRALSEKGAAPVETRQGVPLGADSSRIGVWLLPPDGVKALVDALKQGAQPTAWWLSRFDSGDGDPCDKAWSSSNEPLAMIRLLEAICHEHIQDVLVAVRREAIRFLEGRSNSNWLIERLRPPDEAPEIAARKEQELKSIGIHITRSRALNVEDLEWDILAHWSGFLPDLPSSLSAWGRLADAVRSVVPHIGNVLPRGLMAAKHENR